MQSRAFPALCLLLIVLLVLTLLNGPQTRRGASPASATKGTGTSV